MITDLVQEKIDNIEKFFEIYHSEGADAAVAFAERVLGYKIPEEKPDLKLVK